jgi:hypothetical protein
MVARFFVLIDEPDHFRWLVSVFCLQDQNPGRRRSQLGIDPARTFVIRMLVGPMLMAESNVISRLKLVLTSSQHDQENTENAHPHDSPPAMSKRFCRATHSYEYFQALLGSRKEANREPRQVRWFAFSFAVMKIDPNDRVSAQKIGLPLQLLHSLLVMPHSLVSIDDAHHLCGTIQMA